jgi:PmbA protein
MKNVKRETYRQNTQETSISVMQTRIESIRTKNITRTTARAYDGKRLGVAGALGVADEGALMTEAAAALSREIPYPFEPTAGTHRSVEVVANFNGSQSFVDEMRELMDAVRSHQPGFVFAGKLNLTTNSEAMQNDTGLDYSYCGTNAGLELWIKEKGSANIIDTAVEYVGTTYDRDRFLATTNMICDAFRNRVDIDDGEYPVVFLSTDYLYRIMLARSLNGLLFGTGTSLFSGKIGEKLFSDKVTLYQSRSEADHIYTPFFDFEGAVNEGDRYKLIDAGTLVAPYTTRTYAAKFNLPHTGAAAGEYDSVPNLGNPGLVLAGTGQTARQIIGGQKAILVLIASGGDFTPDGAFASPVQLGYLYDGEKLVGRIPEANISSHLYDMFGDDFLGVSTDTVLPIGGDRAVVMKMKVEKSKPSE